MRFVVSPVVAKDDNNGITTYPNPSSNEELCIEQTVHYPIIVKIDGLHARVFQTAGGRWWIGAKYQWNVDEFPAMGPYDDLDTAIVFYRLHGDVSKPVF